MAATVFARILLRVLAGVLIGWGARDLADVVTTDPDIISLAVAASDVVIGALVWVAGEVWYFFARRFGWAR